MMISKITKLVEQTELIVLEALDAIELPKREQFLNLRPRDFLDELKSYIVVAAEGIENLKITYSQDRTVVACLDMSLLTLKNCVREIDSGSQG